MGAVTNWEAPIYVQLLTEYQTTVTELNIGAAVLLLLLGVGNVLLTPLSNSEFLAYFSALAGLTGTQNLGAGSYTTFLY